MVSRNFSTTEVGKVGRWSSRHSRTCAIAARTTGTQVVARPIQAILNWLLSFKTNEAVTTKSNP